MHSPIVPNQEWMQSLIEKAAERIPTGDPDCGLKTRGWPETREALKLMVNAAKTLRKQISEDTNEQAIKEALAVLA